MKNQIIMHQNSLLLFDKYAAEHFTPETRVLEIGPDAHPSSYRKRLGVECAEWHTVDLTDDPALTYKMTDENVMPIDSDRYDVVFSAQVIEHVRVIWRWIHEVGRVTAPGGKVITISPVSWPFHEVPIDCWRIYPDGMKALYSEADLEVETCEFESIEGEGRRVLPGRGRDWQGRREKVATAISGVLGGGVECAVDMVTVGRKKGV